MDPLNATHVTGPLSERRSRLDVDEPDAWHNAITPGPDLLVQRPRPIVADLVGPGADGTWHAPGVSGPDGHRGWVVLPVRCRHVCVPGFPA
jgi:hypothetical protein